MIKIDVISGFLGAGKTTLIKKLFEAGFDKEQVVIIENEFGDISIDKGFLKESGVQINEINAGCICCSLVGDFATSIQELIETYSPNRIIIEPSGVGKLSDIVNAIKDVNNPDLVINILATVVDGKKAKMHIKNFGEFFLNQIEAANNIVVSKVETLTEEQIHNVLHLIKEHNDEANIIVTPLNQLDPKTLLKTLESDQSLVNELLEELTSEEHHHHEHCCCHEHDEECHCHEHHHEHHHHDEHCCCHEHEDDCCCHEHHHDDHCHCHDHDEECHCHEHNHEHCHCEDHEDECCCHEHHHEHHECCCGHDHHHADEVFDSWGKETAKSFTKSSLEEFLNRLSNDKSLGLILRAKGFVKASDNNQWYYFDFVSGDYEIRLGDIDYNGRVVVIGSKLNKEKINNLFDEM